MNSQSPVKDTMNVGWAQADLTPSEPVLIAGQFHSRVSEGVADPLTATALALDAGDDQAVLVTCDFVTVPDAIRDAVRARLAGQAGGPDTAKVVLCATHTHTGPEIRPPATGGAHVSGNPGIDLPAMPVQEYLDFAVQRIADAVERAWAGRKPGRIAFGLGQAVIGRNRRWVDVHGRSTMYGNTSKPTFSHIEGYEDHSLGVLATRDEQGRLTGLAVNVPCTSQVSEHEYRLSADYWFETKRELRRRLGEGISVLPLCSAAGDQSPHLLYDKAAANRMLELAGRTEREEIALRIAAAVDEVLAILADRTDAAGPMRHHVETLQLPMTVATEEQLRNAEAEAVRLEAVYEEQRRLLEAEPRRREQPRWYVEITKASRRAQWFRGAIERARRQAAGETWPAEIHVIRLGDIAIATNPFEYYLDFGIYIKARSPAAQTFLAQVAGGGTYVPSPRSVAGGGYGSVPSSNPVGPEGGRMLAERTVEVMRRLWS